MTPDPGKPSPPHILIVDDDPGQRSLLTSFLNLQGFVTTPVTSGEQALDALQSQPFAMMISDVRMPGISGLDTLRRARQQFPHLPVLLVTAFADIRDAVHAMRDGALNYLSKPIDLDELLALVRHATGLATTGPVLVQDTLELPPPIVAHSPLMRAVFRDASLVAASDCRVLITGESGAGKEILADLIHAWSARASGPLVKFNCAAVPETLLESELFGHERGAFTGANAQRIGRFELAHRGTLFLDEITELTPKLQAKLLRVTQDGRFQRIGSNTEIHTDARLLAASNRNLEDEVQQGRFREDLFYRLNVVELNVPPLREHPEDILPLASQFLAGFTQGRARLSTTAAEILSRYTWPGNIRELRNAIERAVLLSRGELILPDHLPARVRAEPDQPAATAGAAASVPTTTAHEPAATAANHANAQPRLDEIERDAILQTLRAHDFNRTETAKALGISRRTLLYKLQQLRERGFPVDPQ